MDGETSKRRHWYDSPLASKQATHGIYFEIVLLALILALEGKRLSDTRVVSTIAGAMLALILAEIYAYYIGTMIGTGNRPTRDELRAVLVGTGWSLIATVPPILLLLLGVFGPMSLSSGFFAAKVAGVTAIAIYALLASRRAGFGYRRSGVTALVFLAMALGLVFLKQAFH